MTGSRSFILFQVFSNTDHHICTKGNRQFLQMCNLLLCILFLSHYHFHYLFLSDNVICFKGGGGGGGEEGGSGLSFWKDRFKVMS